jgi:hypothetical protein
MRAKYSVISRSDLDSWLQDARACQSVDPGAWPYLCFLRGVAVGAWLAVHLARDEEGGGR